MRKLEMPTEEQKEIIRRYLNRCLKGGYYEFVVDGKDYSLDSQKDVQEILGAICNLNTSAFDFRLREAENAERENENANLKITCGYVEA